VHNYRSPNFDPYRVVGSGRVRNFCQLMGAVGLACGVAPIMNMSRHRPPFDQLSVFHWIRAGKIACCGIHCFFTPLKAALSDFGTEHLAKDPNL
jgi:hypothetical protein